MKYLRTAMLTVMFALLVASRVPAPAGASAPLATPAGATAPAASAAASDSARDAREAEKILARLAARYRLLDGVTVSIGATPNGEQAIAYYTRGVIVIDRNHVYSVDEILEHEVWHVIDWRDNGRIDWGENLPPSDSAKFLRN